MIWPFSGNKCNFSLECFRGHKACTNTELTLLPAHPPLAATLEGWKLVNDGLAMSRVAPPKDGYDHRHSETIPAIFMAIHNGDVEGVNAALTQDPEAALTTKYGGSLPLHAACYARQFDILYLLLQAGAKVDAMDGLGQTALHLAVVDAWHNGVGTLLQHGASPNTLCEPPPGVKEVRVETALHVAVRRGDLPSTILLLQHSPDLAQRDSDMCSVLHLSAYSRSLEVTRQLLKDKQTKEIIKSKERRGNNVLHMALMNECDTACEVTVLDLVKEFAQAGAEVNHVNLRGESPLFLAAHHRLPRVVEALIGLGADPTVLTRDGQSVLHAACHQGCATSLGHILNTGQMRDLVIDRDSEGYAPFHYAVHSGSIDCCELLLTSGDHLTRVDKDGLTRCSVILRNLPSATQLLTRLFDSHVRLSSVPRHDPNFRVTFDYSVIYLEEEGNQSLLISELSNSRLEALLKHPLLESFLYLKWYRIKPFFYCTVLFYAMFLGLHTSFITLTFGQDSWHWQSHPDYYTMFLILHITMFLLILIPDLVIMFANLKKYLTQWETYTKITALTSSAFVVFSCVPYFKEVDSESVQYQSTTTSWENSSEAPAAQEMSETLVSRELVRRAAAISAFFTWLEFMMLLGRFPSLGSYVLMFTRVARAIIKFLAAFFSLIIGFAVSFLVLFQEVPEFSTLPLSLTKTLMMMIGEIDYGNLFNELNLLSGLFLVAFLFLVCVLMANLLIGLAVSDLPDLQRQGKIRRLSKQASYLVSYERLMVVTQTLCCFPRQLRVLLTHRCKVPQVVNVFPNKNRRSSISQREDEYHVLNETLQEAMMLGTEDSKIEFNPMEEEDSLATQFRLFKIKYDRDRRQLQRRLVQLPDTTTTENMLKERLDCIQQMVQNQFFHLFLQLQKQHYLCSRCSQHSPNAQSVQISPQAGQCPTGTLSHCQGINVCDATRSSVMYESPDRSTAQQTQSLPETWSAPQLIIPQISTVQRPSQQYPSKYAQ